MPALSHLTEDEKRRRGLQGTMEAGDYLEFNVHIVDGSPSGSATSPAARDAALAYDAANRSNAWRGNIDALRHARVADSHPAAIAAGMAAEASARDRANLSLNDWRRVDSSGREASAALSRARWA